MNIDDARAGLADIAARQDQAVAEAARWRWPRWYVAGTAALMLAVSVALGFEHDPALVTVVYCWGVGVVQIPLAASMRVRRHRSRDTQRAAGASGAPAVAVAAGSAPRA